MFALLWLSVLFVSRLLLWLQTLEEQVGEMVEGDSVPCCEGASQGVDEFCHQDSALKR